MLRLDRSPCMSSKTFQSEGGLRKAINFIDFEGLQVKSLGLNHRCFVDIYIVLISLMFSKVLE